MSICPENDIHSVYLDGELNSPYKEQYLEHLQTCSSCSEKLQKLKSLQNILQEDSKSITLTEEQLDASYQKLSTLLKFRNVTKKTTNSTWTTIYKAIPASKLDKAEIFMGVDEFRDLVLELTAKNLYHHNPAVDSDMEIILPGTSTIVRGVSGLNETAAIVASAPDNIYYGVDMEGDDEAFDLWYSKDNQEFRLALNFIAGVQVAFPDEVVVLA
jgi:hypothetical protein